MNYSLEHIALPAADPAALKSWYARVLGAQSVWDDGRHPPTCLIALPGGICLELYAAQTAPLQRGDNRLAGYRHLALRVNSLETARSELAERGVAFTGDIRPAAGGGRVLFFADPEGNLLHLVERPEQTAPRG